MYWTRRRFVTQIGQAGGYSAAFLAMQGLGFLPAAPAQPRTIAAAPGSGRGKSVVILGAGIAGLVAAYELRDLGYTCTILEARERPGGRNWTIRPGDTIALNDGSRQTCTWDASHYQNFGPARLPSIHPTILGYCRRLGVELQVEVNMTNSARLQNDAANGGQPAVMRQVINDTRGHVSELLNKCVNAGALDAELTADDRTRMLDFLRTYGPLDEAGKYAGSDRAGYSKTAGAGDDTGVLAAPVDMHTLLDENFWQGVLFDQQFDMQATMFQPVGGMDRIPYAFAKSLGDIVRYNAPVKSIHRAGAGVEITYTRQGAAQSIKADFCLNGLPLNLLRGIPNDFSPDHRQVITDCTYAAAYKIAWESRRFWEQDENIYGGLEFCNTGCSPIWFPSAGMFTPRGILVSGYTDESSGTFGPLTLPQKFAESRKSIERLHPGRGRELEKPMYVGWGRVPFNEGSWIRSYSPAPAKVAQNPATTQPSAAGQAPGVAAQAPGIIVQRETGVPRQPGLSQTGTNPAYEAIIQPDGPMIFIGDHTSHIVAWQEGAALSALRAVQLIADRVRHSAPA